MSDETQPIRRLLVSGSSAEQLLFYHSGACDFMNAIERRGNTILYTCCNADCCLAERMAEQAGLTVQEWDGRKWAVLVQGKHPGWSIQEACHVGS